MHCCIFAFSCLVKNWLDFVRLSVSFEFIISSDSAIGEIGIEYFQVILYWHNYCNKSNQAGFNLLSEVRGCRGDCTNSNPGIKTIGNSHPE
jgi:hypothetical protein